MRPTLALIALLSSLAMPSAAAASLRVVATVPDLGAIAHAVGGEHVDVTVLSAPTEDPHYVDPRPSHLVALSRADVLVAVGLELEAGWLPPLQVQSRNRAVQQGGAGYIVAASYVDVLGAERVVDRSMGDVHPGGNPHFLFDPRAARRVAAGLVEAFAGLDPDNAAAYRSNGAAFDARLAAFAEEQTARFGVLSAERRRAVVYHESLPYLLSWLGIEQVATLEPLPGVPPDPGRVADVVGIMRAQSVRLLLQETYYPRTTSERVAQLAGGTLVVVDGGTDLAAGEDYISNLRAVADAIFSALQ